jgi:cytochrome c oxidase cbb3-type subunit 3
MPRLGLRAEQLAAIADYVFQAPSENHPNVAMLARTDGREAKPLQHPVSRVQTVYFLFCSQCHGLQGNGKGINASHMFVSPRDHTSRDEMAMLTDDRLYAAIKYGGGAVGKSPLMPPWGGVLKDSDIKLLVDYLRCLSGTASAGGN